MGTGTWFIGVQERTPTFVCINIHQDSTSRTYSIKVHQDQIVNPDPRNVQQWLVRVGKVEKLVLVEIINWITPAPQPPSESTPTMSSAQPESGQHPFNFDNQPEQPQQQPDETHLPQSNA